MEFCLHGTALGLIAEFEMAASHVRQLGLGAPNV
jgi:hypothetical protein